MKHARIVATLTMILCAALFATGCAAPSANDAPASSAEPASADSAAAASEAANSASASSAEYSSPATGDLANGNYAIDTKTDSSMFHPVACTLHVQDGSYSATVTLPGEGFSRLFFGTSEEAESASDDSIYDYYLGDDGKYTFDVPVAALNEELAIAAWGQRRDRWYDHTIIFYAPESEQAAAA